MDFAYFLILDSITLMIATFVLSYFFIRDILKKNKESKNNK